MTNFLTKQTFSRMIDAARQKLEANVTELNKLDSATGDGDHGTSIVKAIRAAAKVTSEVLEEKELKDILYDAGWAVMGEDCGSTSSLIGAFFMGMSEGVSPEPIDTQGVAAIFEAGLQNVMKQTKAKVGDKTLMDALIPAVAAMKSQSEIQTAFQAAAAAAQKGADATKDYVAKFGRARNLGERSIGHIDAGAVSIAYIFGEFAQHCTE
ncbi:MAG: dihydroxyacetone kinase subunit L [Planctomycetaceae bacterium]|jgi:dihydroxyacetone kinase-like protein|nr:dihydroxyacetone kinase subunit L [Planctomycetaceae bacterium]